jgi:hypothetical protein
LRLGEFMHTCPIKIRVITFTVSIFSVLNLFGFHAVRHTSTGYGVAGENNNFSDARSANSNYATAILVTTGRRPDTPDTAEIVTTGATTDPQNFCARLCACLCFLRTDRESDDFT